MVDVAHIQLRANVRAQVSACRACNLCDVGSGPIPFRGPSPTRLVVIGEAPGKVEDTTRKPFVGPSGELATSRLASAGLSPESVTWLNVVSCFPNRTPTQREVEACKPNLMGQLSLIRPSACLIFGGVAVSAWWPNIRMGDIRGMFWRGRVEGMDVAPWIMATWHPAAVLRNGIGSSRDKEMSADIRRFRELADTVRVTGVAPDPSSPLYLPLFLRTYNTSCVSCGNEACVWEDENGVKMEWAIGGLGWCRKCWEKMKGFAGKGKMTGSRPSSARKIRNAPVQDTFL